MFLGGSQAGSEVGTLLAHADQERRQHDGGDRTCAQAPQQRLRYGCHRDPRLGTAGDVSAATAGVPPNITGCYLSLDTP
ncbi:hypothetical protein GCM10009864_73750 [Streptomyces lunalinharesii]|uniref:Uncharacterized protein n=1 Tax=Streptomyces lunalinharesii TaxID=333384 RepID=A0ABN3SY97_9ACTN